MSQRKLAHHRNAIHGLMSHGGGDPGFAGHGHNGGVYLTETTKYTKYTKPVWRFSCISWFHFRDNQGNFRSRDDDHRLGGCDRLFCSQCGAGVGLVLILRWFWWRINAWSEIAAMIAPVFAYSYIRFQTRITFPDSLYYICLFTTLTWLLVTLSTRPTDIETLKQFYLRVRPGGVLWKPIASLLPEVQGTTGYGKLFLDWAAGIVLVYSCLFGTGKFLFGDWGHGAFLLGLSLAAFGYLWRDLNRMGWIQSRSSD